MCFLFFFKQKTAYEMRISDWSSDVCSSDLPPRRQEQHRRSHGDRQRAFVPSGGVDGAEAGRADQAGDRAFRPRRGPARGRLGRSEEHTSELQSLMRIASAVFCLTKTKEQPHHGDITSVGTKSELTS